MPTPSEPPLTRRLSARKSNANAAAAAAAAAAASASAGTPSASHQQNARDSDFVPTPSSVKGAGGSKTTLGAGVKQLPGGGGIFKSAAVAVLRLERKLMSTGDITRVALERGLIKCQGKTPEATMASALYTDVKRKEDKSIFTRPQEGLFGLKEWAEEGFVPDPVIIDGHVAPAPAALVKPEQTTSPSATPKSAKHAPNGMQLRQRSDIKKPWLMDDDDSKTSVSSPGERSQGDTPATGDSKSRMDYAEMPGKQRLKHAFKMKMEMDEKALQGAMTPPSSTTWSGGGTSVTAGDLAGLDDNSGGRQRKRPCLSVEVPGTNGAQIHSLVGGAGTSAAYGAALGTNAALRSPNLLQGLDTSRLIGSGGLNGMDHPGLLSFLPNNSESVSAALLSSSSAQIRSPMNAAILGSLDTPALMNMQLPEGLPLTPEALAAAAIRSGLTPRWGLTPRMSGGGISSSPGPLSARFPSGFGTGTTPSSSGPLAHIPMSSQPQDADRDVTTTGGSGATPSFQPPAPTHSARGAVPSTTETGSADPGGNASLQDMEMRVLTLEKSLGRNHPQVGKAWLFLCRAAHAVCLHLATNTERTLAQMRAERALLRAKEISLTCHNEVSSMSAETETAFSYLLEKVRGLNTGKP